MCPVCAEEAQGITITPRIEALIGRKRAVERDFADLFEIAQEFASGQFRSEGSNIACVHCDAVRRTYSGFHSEHHEEDCPVRRLNTWWLDYKIRNKD